MIHKFDVTIPELSGNELRSAYIYLPESYNDTPDRHYPVLYMFDGHNVFFDADATYGKCWGMKEYMDASGTQMIIAAIECNHSPDNGRLREYSPFTFNDSKFGKIQGLGKTTMNWMIHSFKKEIDSHFRTIPEREYTYIAGSSMGGLMSLYAVLEYNDIFSKAAALSPSLWTAPARIMNLIKHAKLSPDTVVYMDYGSQELHFHANMEKQFGKTAALLLNRQIMLTSRIVPGGTHSETSWEKQIPFFMNTLLYEQ